MLGFHVLTRSVHTHCCHADDVTGCAADGFVSQVNVSVDVLNTLGMLMWVNPAFEELTGYRFDEIQNCPLTFMEDTDGENKMGPAVNEVCV